MDKSISRSPGKQQQQSIQQSNLPSPQKSSRMGLSNYSQQSQHECNYNPTKVTVQQQNQIQNLLKFDPFQRQNHVIKRRRSVISVKQNVLRMFCQSVSESDKQSIYYAFLFLEYFKECKEKLILQNFSSEDMVQKIYQIYDIIQPFFDYTQTKVELLMDNLKNEELIEKEIDTMIEKYKYSSVKNYRIKLFIFLQSGKIVQLLGKPTVALKYLRIAKRLASDNNDYIVKMKTYKTISKCLLMLDRFEEAKQFACKYLQYAWYCKRDKDELKAYELLGIYYFYRNDINTANYYMKRFEQDIFEDDNSQNKEMCIRFLNHKIKFSKHNTIQKTNNKKEKDKQKQSNNDNNDQDFQQLQQEQKKQKKQPLNDTFQLQSSDEEDLDSNIENLIPYPKEQSYLAKFKRNENLQEKLKKLKQQLNQKKIKQQKEEEEEQKLKQKQNQFKLQNKQNQGFQPVQDDNEDDFQQLNESEIEIDFAKLANPSKKPQLNPHSLREGLPFNPTNDNKFLKYNNDRGNRAIYQPRQIQSIEFTKKEIPRINLQKRMMNIQKVRSKYYLSHKSNLRSHMNDHKDAGDNIDQISHNEYHEAPQFNQIHKILLKINSTCRIFNLIVEQYIEMLVVQSEYLKLQQERQKQRLRNKFFNKIYNKIQEEPKKKNSITMLHLDRF